MPTQPFFWVSQANAPIDSLPGFDDAAETDKKTLRLAVNRSRRQCWRISWGDETGAVVEGCKNCRPHSPLCWCANAFTMRMPVD